MVYIYSFGSTERKVVDGLIKPAKGISRNCSEYPTGYHFVFHLKFTVTICVLAFYAGFFFNI